MTTAAGTAARPSRAASTPVNTATITGRNLRRLVRVPTLLVFATVQPVLFVLVFTYAPGRAVRDHESAGLAGVFAVVILFCTSCGRVSVASMPGWMQAFARATPITVFTDALRALCPGCPTTRRAAEAAAWLIGLLAVTV